MSRLDLALGVIPLWVLGLGYLVFLLIVCEIGIAAGRRPRARERISDQASLGMVQAGMLGLLGLLLAFTYAQAADRYQLRKRLLVQEANAIGTFWLRTDFLPAPERAEDRRLLARYVDLRVAEEGGVLDPKALQARFREAEAIHTELWTVTTRPLATRPPTVLDSLLISSLNELIDLHTSRLAAYEERVPGAVLGLVALVSALGLFLVGFSFGLADQRAPIFVLVLTVAVVAVTMTVVDLDRSHRGLIRTSQTALRQLQRTMKAPPPPARSDR
jgi:hypothetical protein